MPRRDVPDDIKPLPTPARVDGKTEARVFDFTNSDVQEHLDYVFEGTHGYVFLASYDRSADKPKPIDHVFEWPKDYGKMVQWIADTVDTPWTEIFYCPYPMKTEKLGDKSGRAGGNSSSRRLVHADMDRIISQSKMDRLREWGFRLVATGTPGHYQAFARLSRSITLAEHRGLTEALRTYVQGDNKVADNDYVKLPGSWNHKNHPNVKEEKRNDRRYPVRIVHNGRARVDPAMLMRVLKAVPIEAETAVAPRSEWQKVPGSWVYKLPVHLQTYIHMDSEGEDSGRFKQCHAAVLAFAEHPGMSRDHIHTALDSFDPGVEKWGRDRWHDEIDRILGKRSPVTAFNSDDGFWGRRAPLEHVYQTALARRAGPFATLAGAMLAVLDAVPPNVQLPDLGGGIRSLNLFVAMVGIAGEGKGTATRAGFECIRTGRRVVKPPIGSGEGITRLFRKREDGKLVVRNVGVVIDAGEISKLTGLLSRKESTLLGELLAGWCGETLGASNADEQKTFPVDSDTYRMGLIVGAQPEMSQKFLDLTPSGFPQRFIFFPVINKDQPRELPECPRPYVWEPPHFPPDDEGVYTMPVCQEIRDYFEEASHIRVTGGNRKRNPLDGHGDLARLKMAAALGLMDGRADVNAEDWELSGYLMSVSRRTRDEIVETLNVVRQKIKTQSHADEAAKAVAVADRLRKVDVARTEKRILVVLKKKAGQWLGMSSVKTECGKPYREWFTEAVRSLIRRKDIEHRKHEYRGQTGDQIRLAG